MPIYLLENSRQPRDGEAKQPLSAESSVCSTCVGHMTPSIQTTESQGKRLS